MTTPPTHLLAGTAATDITPPVGVDLTGYVARLEASSGIHDPLFARALALKDGDQDALLIVCDLIGLEASFIREARRSIGRRLGLPTDAIMIACTHTHSGPATLALHECGHVVHEYLRWLPSQLHSVAEQAVENVRAVTLSAGKATLPKGLYNRRRDGGAIDADVPFGCLRDARGTVVALLTNYGCHPVVLGADNVQISADYPGAAVRALDVRLGGMAFFLTGADGNVDPVRRGSFEAVGWLGDALAKAVIAALPEAQLASSAKLAAGCETLCLPLGRAPSQARLQAEHAHHRQGLADAERQHQHAQARVHRAMLAWAEETLDRVQRAQVVTAVDAELQVLCVGDLCLVGVPGELFSSLGMRIKTGIADRQVLIVGYANGDVGYIPDRAAYAGGGYEVTDAYKYYGAPAALAPEAGEMVVARSIALARAVIGGTQRRHP
jgi:hypothetical protein